jgi:glyoxylase-like metal-dependent hydrolase (beta-lactamase superfamily II)
VLLFDAGHHPSVTREIVAQIKQLTPVPVRYLAVSHWHDDHWVGAAEVADAFPQVEVVAHPFTAKLIETRRNGISGETCRGVYQRDSKELRERVQAARGPNAEGVSEERRKRAESFLADLDAGEAECAAARYRSVDKTVAGTRTIDLGGRTVELRFLGRANTAGDLVAILPESRTILTGDIVVHPFPYATQSYIPEWARVLRAIERLAPATIVTGHGPVFHDLEYVRTLASLFESIDRQARAAYRPGVTVDGLRPQIDLASFRETIAHGDAFIAVNFDNMMASAIDRMWQELAGKLQPEGVP